MKKTNVIRTAAAAVAAGTANLALAAGEMVAPEVTYDISAKGWFITIATIVCTGAVLLVFNRMTK